MSSTKPARFQFHLHAPADMTEEEWAEARDTAVAFIGTTANFAILLGSVLAVGFVVFHIWGA